jgi:hypothetical protein
MMYHYFYAYLFIYFSKILKMHAFNKIIHTSVDDTWKNVDDTRKAVDDMSASYNREFGQNSWKWIGGENRKKNLGGELQQHFILLSQVVPLFLQKNVDNLKFGKNLKNEKTGTLKSCCVHFLHFFKQKLKTGQNA